MAQWSGSLSMACECVNNGIAETIRLVDISKLFVLPIGQILLVQSDLGL